MGLTAQEIKKIYYRVNESVNEESEEKEEVKSLRDTIHDVWNQAANEEEKREEDAKWLKTEAKSEIKCPNCGHMNDADAKKCSNCGHDLTKSEEKDSKKKTMTGSPASKVDTTPEVEFEK
jgi:DNA-directed RNA polymerase subunit RPC12/RpoP